MLVILEAHGKSSVIVLALKASIRTAADNSLGFFFNVFSEQRRLDISCESSARQRIHMKHKALLFFIRQK